VRAYGLKRKVQCKSYPTVPAGSLHVSEHSFSLLDSAKKIILYICADGEVGIKVFDRFSGVAD
jgi:hypothetical protein